MKRALLIVAAALGIWLATAIIALLVVNARVPVQLPLKQRAIVVDSDFVKFGGTWTIEGSPDAFPLQTSDIECDRAQSRCVDATAQIVNGYLRARVATYQIASWTRTQLVFTNDAPLCVRYIYTLDLISGNVAGVRTRKPQTLSNDAVCSDLEKELHISLVDGVQLNLELQHRATPWYGRLALFFLR